MEACLTSARVLTASLAVLGLVVIASPSSANATGDKVVELTQTGCQFLESENHIDRGFEPTAADDCKRINAETGEQRLAEAPVLELAGT